MCCVRDEVNTKSHNGADICASVDLVFAIVANCAVVVPSSVVRINRYPAPRWLCKCVTGLGGSVALSLFLAPTNLVWFSSGALDPSLCPFSATPTPSPYAAQGLLLLPSVLSFSLSRRTMWLDEWGIVTERFRLLLTVLCYYCSNLVLFVCLR